MSGAERLATEPEAENAGRDLIRRALEHSPDADHIQITFERVPSISIRRVQCLQVTTVDAPDPITSRKSAERILLSAGVGQAAVDAGFKHLLYGGHNGSSLRGALLVCARNGDILAEAEESGVRASHFDYAPEWRDKILQMLDSTGLTHFRTREALALSTKVIATGLLAELCWSDNAGYKAGYVSSEAHGYVRYPHFKPDGAVGGRVFYYSGEQSDLADCVRRLKAEDVLIEGPVSVRTIAACDAAEAPSVS